jgi:hypothetical protein
MNCAKGFEFRAARLAPQSKETISVRDLRKDFSRILQVIPHSHPSRVRHMTSTINGHVLQERFF